MTDHPPFSPMDRERKKDRDREIKQGNSASVSSSQMGSVLDLLLSLLRKVPITVVVLVVAILIYYRQPDEEPLPRFRESPDSAPVSLPAGSPSPETEALLPLFQCVKAVDSALSRGPWRDAYLGMEVRSDGKVLTIAVTEKWQGLTLEQRREMVQQVIDSWVVNGRTLDLLRSAEELEAVNFKQVPLERLVATWRPASGPQLLTSG